jgi:hypothetical protein
MRRWLIVLTVFVVVLTAVSPVVPTAAATHPLLQMLAMVPDTSDARDSEVSYVDFRALVEARPGAARPKTAKEWAAIEAAGSSDGGLYRAALLGVRIGSPEFLMQFLRPEETIKTVGIDPYSVDRLLTFGTPPRTALILGGAFDPTAIGAALKAQTFVENQIDKRTVWCSPDGCEAGLKLDLKSRTINNPFGGQLGRKQPVAVQPDYVYSSADFSVVHGIAAAIEKKQPSLAEAKEYLAVAEAFTASGTLIQVYFINPKHTSQMAIPNLAERPGADKIATTIAKDFVPIPQYSLVALAHIVERNEQWAVVALVYDRAADAKTAADALPKKITTYQSLAVRQPFMDLVKDRGGMIDTPQIYTSAATGKSVLTVTFRGPIEPETPIEGGKLYRASGLLFSLLVESIIRRDIGWLAVNGLRP